MRINSIYLINFINWLRAKECRIGFVINGLPLPYNKIMASTRIRVYDVIKMFFNDKLFLVELHNRLRKYDAVIFQKKFDKSALSLAKKLKENGTKIVLDINVNYYDRFSRFVSKEQYEEINKFTKIADWILTPTEFLERVILFLHPEKRVDIIEESVPDKYFSVKKEKFNLDNFCLVWAGYSIKAYEILLIKNILEKLSESYNFKLLIISDKNPEIKIKGIKVEFKKYNESLIVEHLLEGDIFIAPRNLEDSYNMGHSFTKIGNPMALGLPVLASPVPSYKNSPAILCTTEAEWEKNLSNLFQDENLLIQTSLKGREFVKRNYSVVVIKEKYRNFFKKLFNNKI